MRQRPRRRALWCALVAAAAVCLTSGGLAQAETITAKPELSRFTEPIPGAKITTGYNERGPMWSVDANSQGGLHKGIDYAQPTGTNVGAAMDGRISEAGRGPSWCGNWVVIQASDGLEATNCHLSHVSVSAGQKVQGGDKIGDVGESGNTSGPHLHLEFMREGVWLNAEKLLN